MEEEENIERKRRSRSRKRRRKKRKCGEVKEERAERKGVEKYMKRKSVFVCFLHA
jgi:hypothetical protein